MTKVIVDGVEAAPLVVDVQYVLEENDAEEPPSLELISEWAQAAFSAVEQSALNPEVTIRIVDEAEIRDLNQRYRNKDKATNVLSFPFENEFSGIAEIALELLGDVVLCHSVIVREAKQQAKTVSHHYAHMVTHGILHLCGYNHENDRDAQLMETLEARILTQHNIADPYAGACATQ